jgi:two-component sensor histidine kinase
MTLLLLAVLLLPAGYAVHHAIERYRFQGEQQLLDLNRTARLIADYRANTLGDLQNWLEQMGRMDVLPVVGPACNRLLEQKRDEMRLVSQLLLVAPSGRIMCDTTAERVGTDISASFWFQRAIRGSAFTVSELLRAIGEEQTLVAAVPIYGGDRWRTEPWSPHGVLAATIDLEAFTSMQRSDVFPPDHEVYLIDRLGQRVPPLPWLDNDGDAPGFDELLRGERRNLAVALPDARTSLLATADVGFTGLQMVVATPAGASTWLSTDVLIPILLPALMLVVGVIAIFGGTHLVVNRHVERLAEAVRRHRPGGDGLARAIAHAPNELGELGARFAKLTEDLEEREASLRRAVAQKDLLLREVNHRVKNNLQVVASLLRMRARSGQTAESRAAIRDAHARIEAIALVHRRIYEEGAVEQVELSAFLGELVDHLRKSIGSASVVITLDGDIEGVRLATDRAVSLALLVTELVTNAIEHAFAGRPGGTVRIRLEGQPDGGVVMAVADDGIGFDHEATHQGTGINLSELLARQLGGELVFAATDRGTRVELRLPADRATGAGSRA